VLEQPGDVTFVIDSLLELNEEAGHGLASAIDADRIAVSGHSLGGLTALLVTFGPDRDARVKASLGIAPPACFVSSLGVGGEAPVPTLVLVGSNDLIVPPANAKRAYDLAIPPRYYVELAGAEHVRFADVDLTDAQITDAGGLTEVLGDQIVGEAAQVAQALGGDAAACAPSEAAPSNELISADRQRELMRIVGTLFFEAYLRDNADAKELLPQLGELVPEARVESDLG